MITDSSTGYQWGSIRITPDIPKNVELPPAGVFSSIEVANHHPIDPATSRVIDDASIPAMVTVTLTDGTLVSIWPNGTCQVSRDGEDTGHLYSISASGILPSSL